VCGQANRNDKKKKTGSVPGKETFSFNPVICSSSGFLPIAEAPFSAVGSWRTGPIIDSHANAGWAPLRPKHSIQTVHHFLLLILVALSKQSGAVNVIAAVAEERIVAMMMLMVRMGPSFYVEAV
jgi:hypothetical protein